ncbi:pyridoxamine 5'-phosphate oxidase family protein [Paenibacillus sp. NFR01]|uniref:pyridoxamine 5'-phosphate oxidase family protein n=1 Tax=Paenibacillus sp. NFR01 TaxID=1566279 RepID=UPI000B88D37E|nr:pyridoxamine 5'-phosphate oxidase family protein [Paenibacillus sp. NFR01]
MRRKEFLVENEAEVAEFLHSMSFGFLATVDSEGRPLVTPLNFVYMDGCFYFHGSHAGAKMNNLRDQEAVCFSVADEFAIIPSYYTDPNMACPASAYFKSVTASGKAEKVEDLAEKATVMSRFMEKLQPEGGYDPIDAEDSRYRPMLKAVAVVRIVPEQLTAKFKFGQNLQAEERGQVIEGLTARGGERDPETIEMMNKYCPYHSGKQA